MELEHPHGVLRATHIGVGIAGLILFWIPALARKGSRLHVRGGRLFSWCAYYVGATGLVASVWGVAHPASFLASLGETLDSQSSAQAHANVRFILSITAFLALGVLAGVVMGRRVMHASAAPAELRAPLVVGLVIALLLWSAGLLAYGAMILIASATGWDAFASDRPGRAWILVALGAYGACGGLADLRFIRSPEPTADDCRAVHIECMIGAGSGFYAAFFLFGASRGLGLQGVWQLAAPLVPLVVGGIATTMLIRKFASGRADGVDEMSVIER